MPVVATIISQMWVPVCDFDAGIKIIQYPAVKQETTLEHEGTNSGFFC